MDLAQATNATETIELAGKEYPVRMLEMPEWGRFMAWLKKASPSPLTRAVEVIKRARDEGEPLDSVTSDQLLDHAQRASTAWPPKMWSRTWYEVIDSIEGGLEHAIHAILVAADPAFTKEEARRIAARITFDEWDDLQCLARIGSPAPRKKAAGATDLGSPETTTASATTGEKSSPR